MCPNCQNLIKAIDRYIEKADDNMQSELSGEGYVDASDTVKAINDMEDGIADALTEETDYIVHAAEEWDNLEEFVADWDNIKAADTVAGSIATVARDEFTKYMPEFITGYLQQTDRDLKLNTISQKTTAWISEWSEQLGEIMKLDSHNEIEKILTDGLAAGDGIGAFTAKIKDSGIRDEYYRARRVSVTEVLRAHSVSQQEAMMQSPVVIQKRWRHTGGYRNQPRQNHVDMDGQIVDKEDPYVLIGADGMIYHPMYPRDTSLPPGESINCHCLSEAIADEDILGLSLEEREALQAEAVEQMDDEWEAEQNAANMLASLLGSS